MDRFTVDTKTFAVVRVRDGARAQPGRVIGSGTSGEVSAAAFGDDGLAIKRIVYRGDSVSRLRAQNIDPSKYSMFDVDGLAVGSSLKFTSGASPDLVATMRLERCSGLPLRVVELALVDRAILRDKWRPVGTCRRAGSEWVVESLSDKTTGQLRVEFMIVMEECAGTLDTGATLPEGRARQVEFDALIATLKHVAQCAGLALTDVKELNTFNCSRSDGTALIKFGDPGSFAPFGDNLRGGMVTYPPPWVPGVDMGRMPSQRDLGGSPEATAAKLATFNAYVIWSMLVDASPPAEILDYATRFLSADDELKAVYQEAVRADAARVASGAAATAVDDYARFLDKAAAALVPPGSPSRKRLRLALRMWYAR